MKDIFLSLNDHSVARIIAALVSDYDISPLREVVDDLALTLVAPLSAEYDDAWQSYAPVFMPQKKSRPVA